MNFIFKHGPPRFAMVSLLAGLMFLALAGVVQSARAQESPPSEYQVKAAFLFNFGKFVEWPTNAFANAESPLVIGVFGGDPFHGDLERLVAGQKIAGHPVVVRQTSALPDLKGCHILFIPAAAKEREREALQAAGGACVLTVGEFYGFCEAGGMVNFVIEDRQVHFDINNDAVKAAGLKISSKLLTLARRLRNGS
jgi:hypothetical protein